VYARSLLVVVLCTIFVLGFTLVLAYEAAGIGEQATIVPTSQTTCSAPESSCEALVITSASLRTVNYTDELGVVNYASLTLGLNPSGKLAIATVSFYIGNTSAGQVQGPFQPGVNRVVNLTLPATVSITPGRTYLVSVEGSYGTSLSVWTSTKVTAQ
jgi:hypothetical protein